MSARGRITPRGTPLSAGSTSTPTLPALTFYNVYPPRLPSAPDIVNKRVNVLHPPPPVRQRTFLMETSDSHWHNEQRAKRMKQREHYRYHNAWSKYYYGNEAEKEAYRSFTRSILKQQMDDKVSARQQSFQERLQESLDASEIDRNTLSQDAQLRAKRFHQLKSFRDENKQMMENLWTSRKSARIDENKYDREQLKYNPINWSGTLK